MIWLHVLAPVRGRVHDFRIFDFPCGRLIVSCYVTLDGNKLLNVFIAVLEDGDDSSVVRVGNEVHSTSDT